MAAILNSTLYNQLRSVEDAEAIRKACLNLFLCITQALTFEYRRKTIRLTRS